MLDGASRDEMAQVAEVKSMATVVPSPILAARSERAVTRTSEGRHVESSNRLMIIETSLTRVWEC